MSLLSRLFRRKAQPASGPRTALSTPTPASPPPAETNAADLAPPPLDPAETTAAPAPVEPVDEAADEDEDQAALEDEAADPTIGRYAPLEISVPLSEEVLHARAAAEQLALSGPQRITPVDDAGPGSLAETLVRLEAQGRLTSRMVDDPDVGFAILYEPVRPH